MQLDNSVVFFRKYGLMRIPQFIADSEYKYIMYLVSGMHVEGGSRTHDAAAA